MTPYRRRAAPPAGRLVRPAVLLLLAALLLPSVCSASLYVCIDQRGKKYYSNMAESGNCRAMRSRRLDTFSLSGQWPAYARSSNWQVRYASDIDRYGRRYNIDPDLIKAIIKAESDFNRYAVSRKGAKGLMQLMPETARQMNVRDPFNPQQNIAGGVRYLRSLLEMFNGNLVLSLAAYNAGPTRVKRARGVPRIAETRQYVQRVLTYYRRYGRA